MKGIEIIETIPASRGIKMQVPLFAICLLFLFLTYICIRKAHSIIGIIVAIILGHYNYDIYYLINSHT